MEGAPGSPRTAGSPCGRCAQEGQVCRALCAPRWLLPARRICFVDLPLPPLPAPRTWVLSSSFPDVSPAGPAQSNEVFIILSQRVPVPSGGASFPGRRDRSGHVPAPGPPVEWSASQPLAGPGHTGPSATQALDPVPVHPGGSMFMSSCRPHGSLGAGPATVPLTDKECGQRNGPRVQWAPKRSPPQPANAAPRVKAKT